jgi:DNA-binding response OmpR family regulator
MSTRGGTAEDIDNSRLKLLLADDHAPFTSALRRWLSTENPGWDIEVCNDAHLALATILTGDHDAVLLDWHFGDGMSGLEICRRAREGGSSVPIVMLTMMDEVRDRVAALDAGANDYLVKDSVSSLELCRRIEVAFYRARRGPTSGLVVSVGPITVYVANQSVFVDGQLIVLPKQERHILLRLARTPGEVVPYEELYDVKQPRYGAKYKNLQNEVWRLRGRIGDAGRWIQNVHGVGYRLGEETSDSDESTQPDLDDLDDDAED